MSCDDPWHAICSRHRLADPGSRAFVLKQAGRELSGFLVCQAGEVRAFRNRCPHTGVELNWGGNRFLDVDDAYIQCSMHGALFRPADGRCIHGPCVGRALEALPVRIRNGDIEVAWPQAEDES